MAQKHSDFIRSLKQFEGQTDHLYLDSLGNPTIGIGFMMANAHQFFALPLHTKQHTLATIQQKQDEFNHIKQLPVGYKAAWYQQYCQLHLTEQHCDSILQQHLSQFEKELISIFSRKNGFKVPYHDLPQSVQHALLDMAFNLGSHHLSRHWPKLHQAIKQQNWQRAAQECHRKNIQPARNHKTAQLFIHAEKTTTPAKSSRLYWLLKQLKKRMNR